jgi:pantothenate kinase type III
MLLAIDAGNTNIVFAVCEGTIVHGQWRAVTSTPRTADEYAVMLGPLLGLVLAVELLLTLLLAPLIGFFFNGLRFRAANAVLYAKHHSRQARG